MNRQVGSQRFWILLRPVCGPLGQNFRFHLLGSHGFVMGQDMPVHLQGKGHVGMAQPFTHHFGIDSGRQPLGRHAVAQVMNADILWKICSR